MKSIKDFITESEQEHFYRIDVIDEYDEKNGYSLCVKSIDNIGEDNVIDYAIRKGLIDKYDVEDYIVNVEEITNDKNELNFWGNRARSLD